MMNTRAISRLLAGGVLAAAVAVLPLSAFAVSQSTALGTAKPNGTSWSMSSVSGTWSSGAWNGGASPGGAPPNGTSLS